MSSLAELVQYAQAKQPRNGLAEVASHFIEGASSGYDAGHAEALKNQSNPIVTNPVSGEKQRLDVVGKLLELEDKRASIEQANNINQIIREQTGAKDMNNRQTTLATMADNALKEANGAAGSDKSDAGKLANLVTGTGSAAPSKPKIKISTTGGKSTVSMDFENPKTTTVGQIQAMKDFVEKDSPESTAALATAFPEGVPDWAAKFMSQHSDLKMKKDAIAKEQQQHKFDKDVLTYTEKYESNPTIKALKSQGVALGQVDQMIQLTNGGNTVSASAMGTKMARAMGEVGVLTESDIKRYVQSGELARGAADKLSKWISGKPTDATLEEIQQISNVLKGSFNDKIQPIANTYIERLSRNYHLDPEEAAFRMNLDYRPDKKPGDTGGATGGTEQNTPPPAKLKASEVLRKTGDRMAVFNSATKQFVRWAK